MSLIYAHMREILAGQNVSKYRVFVCTRVPECGQVLRVGVYWIVGLLE